MPFDQIVIRSLSGYLFFAPGLVVYCLVLARLGKRQPWLHTLMLFVFGYYLIGVFTVTGIRALGPFAPRLALVPFVDMIRGPVDTALNVVLFVPFGFFVPLLYGRFRRIGRTAAAGADAAELLLLTGYALLVMVTVQPVFVRTLFGLG